jgi:hypothetical protein
VVTLACVLLAPEIAGTIEQDWNLDISLGKKNITRNEAYKYRDETRALNCDNSQNGTAETISSKIVKKAHMMLCQSLVHIQRMRQGLPTFLFCDPVIFTTWFPTAC